MEQITIRIKDRKKARTLLNFLKSLDFIESVVKKNVSTDTSASAASEQEFFALACGLAGIFP